MSSSGARRSSAAVFLALAWGLTGCSSGDSGGEPGVEPGVDAAPETSTGSDGGADAFGAETSTEAGLDSKPSCIPEPGSDLPDDDFRDSNCDGVDGDASAAIFVAPSGSDTNAGTMTHPVSSLHKAVELAEAAGKSIYLCSATWSEALIVGAPLSIHGGYDCANGWQRTNSSAEVVSSDGPALQIGNVAERVFIERVTFKVGDALVAGGSSVAASVVSSQQVELRRCGFEAGDGANGVSGLPPEAAAGTGPNGQDGGSLGIMTCAKGNPVGDCAKWGVGGNDPMTFSFSKGGRGGDGGNLVKSHAQQSGSAGTPDGAAGGTLGNIGLPGQVGAAGGTGAAASSGMGTIAEGKYVSSNVGSDGESGELGKGGGGGSGGKTGCVPNADCSVETKF
ncbi:MAG TPA: hypothetical protein PLI95_00775, partial [Polyangiaceae bacterium]|nr:hypothetical protein [Polyangiaceae bacterium]